MDNELLIVTDLSGQSEPLIGFNGLKLERTVNGEKILSFTLFSMKENEYSFPLVQEESTIEFKGEKYIIKQANYKPKGKTYYKSVVAYHKFFCDLSDDRVYESYNESLTFNEALDIVLNGSGYTYEVIDQFYSEVWEGFGKKNRLALFQDVLNRYGAEFEIISNTHIRLQKRIGIQTDFQFRFNFNIKTLDYQIDTKSLATYIKGTGKDGITSDYTSPNASLFGIRDAEEVEDERYTTVASLTERLESDLSKVDKPIISITLDFVDLRRAGYPYQVPECGNDVLLIHEPMGLDLIVRIVDITEEFNENLEPIKTSVTLGNIRNTVASSFDQASKTIGDMFDGNGKIKFSFLDAAVQRATQDLQSAQTELVFDNGIIAKEKTNPNLIVLFNSKGIGISEDGGATFRTAMTGHGMVADIINAGTLNAGQVKIMTALSGARIEMDHEGIRQYNVNGDLILHFDPASEFPTFYSTLIKVIADNSLDLNGINVENPYVGVDSRFVTRLDEVVGAVTQIESFANGDLTQPRPIQFRANYIDMFSKVVAEVNMRRLFIKGGSDALTIENANGNGYIAFHNGTNRTGELGNKDTTSNDILLSAITTGAKLILTSQGKIIAFTESGTNGQHINTVDDNARWKQSDNNHITQFTSGNVEIFKNGLFLFRFNSTNDDTDRRMIAGDSGFKFTKGKTPVEIHAINASDTGHVPIVANAFNTPSLRSLKKNIKKLKRSMWDVVKDTSIYEFLYKTEKKGTPKHKGFIYDEASEEIKGNNTIDNNKVNAVLWKNQQEIIERFEMLESEVKSLKEENQILKQKLEAM